MFERDYEVGSSYGEYDALTGANVGTTRVVSMSFMLEKAQTMSVVAG
jgi:hypothetical protein